MTIRHWLEKLALPLLLGSIFFVMTTFMAHFSQEAEWHRTLGINVHRILQLLDLREENTLATWFSSIIFLTVGIVLVLPGWSTSSTFVTSRPTRWLFQLGSIGAILLSADEVASIHETAGKWFERMVNTLLRGTSTHGKGFLWMILFGPFLVFGLIGVIVSLRKLITNMPNSLKYAPWIHALLFTALLCLLGVFVFETLEAHATALNQKNTIFPCFEEAGELIGMYSLFLCTLLIAKQYEL